MTAKKLENNSHIKILIVRKLAAFEYPSKIAAELKEKFGLEISRQAVQNYDPTKVAGKDLSEKLKVLFFEERTAYRKAEARKTDELIKAKVSQLSKPWK